MTGHNRIAARLSAAVVLCLVGASASSCHSRTMDQASLLEIETPSLPTLREGDQMQRSIQVEGAQGSCLWSLRGAPPWLRIDATRGTLQGAVPAGAATASPYVFTILVRDSAVPPARAAARVRLVVRPTQKQWESRGIGGGGALYSCAFNPFDPGVITLATDMGTTYRTMRRGRSWQAIPFTDLQGGVDTEIRYTSDPSRVYSVNNGGYLRTPVESRDGGQVWAPLPNDPTWGEIFRLFADPQRTDRLVVSSYAALFFSDDGGTTWKTVRTTTSGAGLHIAGAFFSGNQIIIATSEGLLVSSDGGQSFSLDVGHGMPGTQAMVSFAGGSDGSTIRLLAVAKNRDSVWAGITGEEIWGDFYVYVRDWGVTDWRLSMAGIGAEFGGFHCGMALDDITNLYLAGGDKNLGFPSVYKSGDGGGSWAPVLGTVGNQNVATGWAGWKGDVDWWWGGLTLGFAVSPVDSGRVIVTDMGFVHLSEDGGQSWRQAYVDEMDENPSGAPTPKGRSYQGIGLQQTTCWWIEWASARHLFAGFSDFRGVRSRDGGQSWRAGVSLGLPDNTTYHVVVHPVSGLWYAATSSVHDLYQSTTLGDGRIDSGDGRIITSSDGGLTWETMHLVGHPVVWLALDPSDPETLYASVVHSTEGGIYTTHDLSAGSLATWTKLAAPPRTEGHPYILRVLNDGTLVCTYSGRLDGSGAFTESSGVFVSSDGGQSWLDRSDPDHMTRWTKEVVIDPHDATQNTWYVGVFSHWGSWPNEVGGLYRTRDRGSTWSRIADLYRVESITIHPTDPDRAWVTTETEGLVTTRSLSVDSPTFEPVEAYLFQHPMRIFFNPYDLREIWSTSFGAGLHVWHE